MDWGYPSNRREARAGNERARDYYTQRPVVSVMNTPYHRATPPVYVQKPWHAGHSAGNKQSSHQSHAWAGVPRSALQESEALVDRYRCTNDQIRPTSVYETALRPRPLTYMTDAPHYARHGADQGFAVMVGDNMTAEKMHRKEEELAYKDGANRASKIRMAHDPYGHLFG